MENKTDKLGLGRIVLEDERDEPVSRLSGLLESAMAEV